MLNNVKKFINLNFVQKKMNRNVPYKSKYKKTNSIAHNLGDNFAKKSRTKTIKKIGYVDELLKEYKQKGVFCVNIT